MDLDARQTRRLFLAGTVAFPQPFPSTGEITFEGGNLKFAGDQAQKPEPMVAVQEHARRNRSSRRVVLQDHVTALFIPGTRSPDGTFCISRKKWVNNFERGEWFLHSDVNPDAVRDRLAPEDKKAKGKNGKNGDTTLRGIIFLPEHLPVVSMTEETTTAGEALECIEYGCTCERREFGCTCDKWCTCDWY